VQYRRRWRLDRSVDFASWGLIAEVQMSVFSKHLEEGIKRCLHLHSISDITSLRRLVVSVKERVLADKFV
jgi:hypothetical protein